MPPDGKPLKISSQEPDILPDEDSGDDTSVFSVSTMNIAGHKFCKLLSEQAE